MTTQVQMPKIYNIIEVANVHGGDESHLVALINDFSVYRNGFGIKFQVFQHDRIATADFSWYPVYEKLFFTPEQWQSLIRLAGETKDVWLDVFDTYSVEILRQNLGLVFGLKLQTSILENFEVLDALAELDLSQKSVIINVAGRSLDQIAAFAGRLQRCLKPGLLYLQVGFQAYPTELSDSGLGKLAALRREFPEYPLAFADHIDHSQPDALLLPVTAALAGATLIEKHVRAAKHEPMYDEYSSIPPARYAAYVELMERYQEAVNQPFINAREQNYLATSIQAPVLSAAVAANKTLDLKGGLVFRRSGQAGLSYSALEQLAKGHHLLRATKPANTTLSNEDFRRAVIGTVVACRLKSSRLPRKALAKIGGLTSVEYCLRSCLSFSNVNHTVLATSTTEEDAELAGFTYASDVYFFKGHPEDVIDRYLSVADALKLDVIVRVTADMPFVSDEICSRLLEHHFQTGADYTSALDAAVGTNLEVISVEALRRIKRFFPSAEYSEYMTFYFTSNPTHFRLRYLELPPELVRSYRLTLDYAEDLVLFNTIDTFLAEKKLPVSLPNIFDFLDNHPEVVAINNHLTLKYTTDPELVATLRRHTTIS